MKPSRRVVLIVLVLIAAGILAYLMRDAIEAKIIQPLIFMFWVLGVYYKMLPQALIWIVLVGLILLVELGSFSSESRTGEGRREPRKPHQGGVESLAGWLERAPKGLYYKWLVAQRLGRLARELIAFKRRQPAPTGAEALKGPGWDPGEQVAAYLDSGLNGSFADYPRPRWSFQPAPPTPLDLDPSRAIDILERSLEEE